MSNFDERLDKIIDNWDFSPYQDEDSRIKRLKNEFSTLILEEVIGEDIDIAAEMEKVGRDFQKLDAIAKTAGLLNKFKADLRKIVRGE